MIKSRETTTNHPSTPPASLLNPNRSPPTPFFLSHTLFLLSVHTAMASATLPAHMKPLSMSQYCFTATLSAPLLTHPSRHARQHFHLYSSSSLPPWSCLRAKTSNLMVPLVAQTSDWARQDEEEKEEDKDEDEEEEEEEGSGSDWKAQGVMGEEGVDANQGQEETPARFEDGAELPEDAKLFVGNLPFDISSEKLAQLFEQAGIVEVSEVIYNRQTDQSRGFGFVTMNTVEEAEKAVEMFHQYDLNGRLLTVNKAAPRGTQTERFQSLEPSFRIYVGNLPWQVDSARLEQVFSEYGKVVSARVVYDRESGRSRGFGFVMMSSEAELNDAIAALDGQNLDGRAIRVSVAEERPRRSF